MLANPATRHRGIARNTPRPRHSCRAFGQRRPTNERGVTGRRRMGGLGAGNCLSVHCSLFTIHCQARIARRLLIRHSPGDPAELGSENSCVCDEPRTKPPCRSHGAERDRVCGCVKTRRWCENPFSHPRLPESFPADANAARSRRTCRLQSVGRRLRSRIRHSPLGIRHSPSPMTYEDYVIG